MKLLLLGVLLGISLLGNIDASDAPQLSLFDLIDDRSSGSIYRLRARLDTGVSIEATNSFGETPLIYGAMGCNSDAVMLLIEHKANVHARGQKNETALFWAAWNGLGDLCELLLNKYAAVDAADEQGWTPLMAAASQGHDGICRFLLERGADVNARNREGNTALLLAASYEHAKVCDLLIEKGADVEAKNKKGDTPYFWADFNESATFGDMRWKCVCLLIEKKIAEKRSRLSEVKPQSDLQLYEESVVRSQGIGAGTAKQQEVVLLKKSKLLYYVVAATVSLIMLVVAGLYMKRADQKKRALGPVRT
jgi:ankyrin repeat protein